MESEKVKEIKKALECCTNPVYCEKECPYHIYERHLECINELAKDTLTLINELESENERLSKELDSEWKDRRKAEEDLHKAQWNYKIGLAQSRKRNNELKDRIAELEKVYDRQVRIINDLNIEVVKEQKKLKHFAEMLKEKLEEYRLENEYFIKDEPNGNLWQLNASVFCIEVTQDGGLVDETLKEFIK